MGLPVAYFMNAFLRKHVFFLYIVLTLVFTYIGYKRIGEIYFLLDEWSYMAGVKVEGPLFLLRQNSWIEHLSGLHRPLGTLIQNHLYYWFGYTTTPFVVIGVILHSINTILIYVLVRTITKNNLIACISGLFFTSSSAYVQALSWIAAIIEIPGSTLLALISILCLAIYIEKKHWSWLAYSLVAAYIGFLIKDAVVFLFFVLPTLLFLLERKSRQFSYGFYIFCLGLGLFFILMRVSSYRFAGGDVGLAAMGVSALFGGMWSYVWFLYRSLLYPLIGSIQILIPMRFIQKILLLPPLQWLFDFATVDQYLMLLSLCILLGMYAVIVKIRKYRTTFAIVIILYIASFIPVALYFTQRGSAFIDERHLYFPTIFLGIIFALFIHALLTHLESYKSSIVFYLKAIILLVCLFYFIKQVTVMSSLMNGTLITQNEIKSIIYQLEKYNDQIPHNPIFYITSNRDYYFYQNHKLPFLQGTGFILMTAFWETGKIPPELLLTHFLQSVGTEGYDSSKGEGFGYFYDRDQLAKAIKNNRELNPEQIIAFQYDGVKQVLSPITKEIKLYVATTSGRFD